MLKRSKVSLNKISTDAACELIRNALNRGVNVAEVYVDTVGKPEIYQSMLEKHFSDSGIKFTVSAKADSKYPVVSAASIVAKVNRDRTLNDWSFREFNNKREMIDTNYGCGYPGDPDTKKWMDSNCDPVFGYPSIVRFSWKTTFNYMKNKTTKVHWENYDEEDEDNNTRKPFVNMFEALQKKKKFDFFENNSLIISDFNLN